MTGMIATSQDYQRGYDDGLQEGERRGWEKGKEAAARKLERLGEAIVGIETKWENYAGGASINAAVETIVAAILKMKP